MTKATIVVALAFVGFCLALSENATRLERAEQMFNEWAVNNNLLQFRNNQERRIRIEIFADNLDNIAVLNKQNPNANFGLTKFSAITAQEFSELYLHPLRLDHNTLYSIPFLQK